MDRLCEHDIPFHNHITAMVAHVQGQINIVNCPDGDHTWLDVLRAGDANRLGDNAFVGYFDRCVLGS